MTFVDYAELVWKRLADNQTQQAVADSIGWSRDLVARYSALQKIHNEAWNVVTSSVTGVTIAVTDGADSESTQDQTSVTTPFSENLLRNILDLEPAQQLDLCKCLARGKDKTRAHARAGDPLGSNSERVTNFGSPTRARVIPSPSN